MESVHAHVGHVLKMEPFEDSGSQENPERREGK